MYTSLTLLQAGGEAGIGSFLIPIALMILLMYFMVMRPQKKREKQVQEMRSKLDIGDTITTIGGIIGIVVSMREDAIVIETSSDRTKMRIARWAIQTVESLSSAQDAPVSSSTLEDTK